MHASPSVPRRAGPCRRCSPVALASAGAEPFLAAGSGIARRRSRGRARPTGGRRAGSTRPARAVVGALVFDATASRIAGRPARALRVLSPDRRRLARSGRVVVLGRALEDVTNPAAAAAQRRSMDSFAVCVEGGRAQGRDGEPRRASTPCARARAAASCAWILSPRAAFVTGQPIRVSARRGAGRAQRRRSRRGRGRSRARSCS